MGDGRHARAPGEGAATAAAVHRADRSAERTDRCRARRAPHRGLQRADRSSEPEPDIAPAAAERHAGTRKRGARAGLRVVGGVHARVASRAGQHVRTGGHTGHRGPERRSAGRNGPHPVHDDRDHRAVGTDCFRNRGFARQRRAVHREQRWIGPQAVARRLDVLLETALVSRPSTHRFLAVRSRYGGERRPRHRCRRARRSGPPGRWIRSGMVA